jgi:hypothetical protein
MEGIKENPGPGHGDMTGLAAHHLLHTLLDPAILVTILTNTCYHQFLG